MTHIYSNVGKQHLILRDHLAIDRTILANERTFLSYIRTALTLFVVGTTFIKLFDSFIIRLIGELCFPIGIAIFILGFVRYHQAIKMIQLRPETT
jgi:putative membrane protein